mmetsp:Transcript_29809/g.45698  ORF Transcript_29809/g.45698 Transcript_29809/m.45698 type:complete len:903 (-) Transcript_29809:49-2757(-)|eukprot:CAMPEP_0195288640 /NCGR_PEP_ID=MMETSP0707-20130614/5227_1 /TAXON_ID=33640 /ORGANISM="Asterionellopsis glacialis, Strain CCMP134" /LENGTH=902 /DNA_ID=CAMNT_0040348537 /DNA_START=56 /DNA_END=2764 /DNA_ORIENTATION=+
MTKMNMHTSSQVASARLETTIRMTIVVFIAFTLAYADLSSIIPSSQKYLLGMFGSIIVMRIPTYIFTPGVMIPIFFVMTFFALASITTILAAASVGDGLFLVTIALWSFWVSSLQYGPFSRVTYVFPAFLATAFGLFGMGLVDYIQNGLEFQVDRDILLSINDADTDASSTLPSSLKQYLPLILSSVKELMSGSEEAISTADKGFLTGRNLHFKFTEEGNLSIVIEGGIWIIKLIWKQSGIENPLAVIQNFIIIVLWLIVVVIVSPQLPPWRTSRKDNTNVLIPEVLNGASNFLEAVERPKIDEIGMHNNATDDQIVTTPDSIDTKENPDRLSIAQNMKRSLFVEKLPSPHTQALREQIWEYSNIINGGTSSGLFSAFEPRLLGCRFGKPITCTWLALKDLMETVESAVLTTLAFESIPTFSLDVKQRMIKSLNQCALAIKTHEHFELEDIEHIETPKTEDRTPSFYFDQIAEEINKSLCVKTNKWIDLMDSKKDNIIITSDESRKNLIKNVLVWFVPPISIFARLIEFPIFPLLILMGRRRLDVGKLVHCVKFAIGFTALVCMTHYWDGFRSIEIVDTEGEKESSGVQFTSSAPEKFSGWVLISYSFATMATTEGTIKKSLFRLVGTLGGGFLAWLGLLMASDSEVGMVAWLTITSFAAIYISVDNDSIIKARMGQSTNYGYGGFYVVLTQSVIAMSYLGGNKNRNDLVADRIVSNLTGILMATFLAVIPPSIYGGDPYRATFIAEEIQKSMTECVKLAIDKDINGLREFRESHLKTTRDLRGDILFLIDDAKRFESFAFFRVDPALEHEIGSMAYTSLALSFLAQLSADKLEEDPDHYDDEELDKILKVLEQQVNLTERDIEDDTANPNDSTYCQAIKMIQERLFAHKTNLQGISWGAKW